MTKILRRLEASGFIEVGISDADRRQRIATTLDRHVSLRSSTWNAVMADVGERLDGLSPETTAALIDGMTAIAEIGERHSRRLGRASTGQQRLEQSVPTVTSRANSAGCWSRTAKDRDE